MPAEWSKHKATWLAWPYDEITFPDRIKQAEQIFANIIYHLHRVETVELLVLNQAMQKKAVDILTEHKVNLDLINFHTIDYADVWLRDSGPTFLIDKNTGKNAWVKWHYNAYGEKFPDLLKDNLIPDQIEGYINAPRINSSLIMEGGAIEVNGEGVLLTTEQCLLGRNKLSKQKIEKELQNCLRVDKIIWLKNGIVNDHTDGHIDELARFVSADTIVIGSENDENDPNYDILNQNLMILEKAIDIKGKKFKIIKVPMPKMYYDDGQRAPASYANFYIANSIVLVPQFKDPNDQVALEIMQAAFPDREIIGIDCKDLIYGGGSIHCITQQQPI